MYCRNCGNVIDDNAVICPKCGVATGVSMQQQRTNTLAIVGFAMSFIVALVGLICSIIARRQIKESGEKGMGLATAGLIISIVEIVLYVFLVMVMMIVVAIALGHE